MKKTVITVLTASVLMALPAMAATSKALPHEELGRAVKVHLQSGAAGHTAAKTHAELAKVGTRAVDSSGLGKTMKSNLGDVNTTEIAQALIASSKTIKDNNMTNNGDAKSIELAKAIDASNQIFADGLSLVASKISDATSDSGQAVTKVLRMGQKIASGEITDVKQVESYSKAMNAMTEALLQGAKNSESALDEGLVKMGLDKSKIAALKDCVD